MTPKLFSQLTKIFSYLYLDEADIRRVVATAGLDLAYIEFTGKSINIWHSVVDEASKLYKIEELLRVALDDYPTNPQLQEVCKAYRESVVRGEIPELIIELQSALIKYTEWCIAQNQKFQQLLGSEILSRSAFGQALNVANEQVRLVERQKLWASLDRWFSNWRKRKTFVLLGEEGDGKTWGVASWLHKKIAEDTTFSPVVFLPASQVSSSNPWGLISTAVRSHSGYVSGDKWNDLVKQWLDYPLQTTPTLLIVLDGINQWHDPSWWRPLLEKAMADGDLKDEYSEGKYFTNVAFIVTCRAEYWDRNYRILTNLPFTPFVLQPYNDNELEQALNLNHLERSEFSGKLLDLVRKPRWFNSVVMHRNEIGSMEDITVARLVYEDWRYIYNQKSDIPISDIEFRDLLRQLAEKQVKRTSFLKRQDLNQIINLYPNHLTLLEELRTGRKLHVKEGNVRLSEPLMGLGLGLLLVDQLLVAESKHDLAEVAASWLEDNSGKDFNAYICEMAVLHALPAPEIPQEVKVTLLLVWLNNQNLGQDTETKFTSYLLDNADSYLDLCERIWTNDPNNRKAQDLLISAFLYWYPRSLPVQIALKKAVERWLGMVHIAGFPQQRGNESQRIEDVKARISQQVGFTLQLGDFTYAGRTLTAIDDDNLLRLGRAALAIISHFPRGPFIHSIATGCVAEAIMDRPDKYELFRWVLSTAPEPVWAEVQHEVERLLTFNSPVAQQAASRLLSFEGSKQAHKLYRTLPSDLFPEHFLHSEHKKDPCLSWFAWNKEICEACLRRTDLEAQYIARRMETHAVDPSLTVPDELRQRFAELAETISIDQIWSTLFTGVQDLAYERYELALSAFVPETIGNVVRKIVQTIHTRNGLALRQVSFRLREHALLFDQEEMKSIYQAWQQIHQVVTTWQEEQKFAEMMLFSLVLSNLSAEEQLAHLLQRPDDVKFDLLHYEYYFLPIKNWYFVEDLFETLTTEQNLLRLLWFISVHAERIPDGFLLAHVMPFLESSSAQVRRLALQVIHNSQNRYLGLAVVGGWKRDLNNLDEENSLGSLILCKYGSLLTIGDLCQRIDPSYWGHAVQYRGNHPAEVNYFAEKIHTLWQHISNQTNEVSQNLPQTTIDISTRANRYSTEREMLSISNESQKRIQWRAPDQTWGGNDDNRHLYPVFPTDEEINEQRAQDAAIIQAVKEQEIAAGNPWFARRFNTAALEHVVVTQPDLLEQWLQAVSEQNTQRLRILQRCHSFYEALCVVLLQYSPEKGVNLYLQMDRVNLLSRDAQTRWRFVDQALFRTNPVGVIDELWKKKLQACTTDAQLLTLASMLQWGAGKEWLWAYIDQQLESNTPLGVSRSITLLGYCDNDIAQGRLNELLDEAASDTWIKQLLENSINRWHLNAWSRHWFSRIFSTDTNVDAWAAFRLFLRCVDSRFWIWHEQIKDASAVNPDFERRWQHIEINWETIRNRIRKNEDGFEKHLFGQKILQKQAWPWM